MKEVSPQVFLVAETTGVMDGVVEYLDHVGAPTWASDTQNQAQGLVEFMGRLCYRSFEPGLNPNVTRVRNNNAAYIDNLLKSRHGSVLEHVSVSFVFADVSRVFTHELVRHRAGTAISQESLRFVRLEDLSMWAPTVVREDEHIMEVFVDTFERLGALQKMMAEHYGLDAEGAKFGDKKEATSAMRRLAPIGLATTIGWTANIRALRHVLEFRTAPSAEEEIRLVFSKVGEIVSERYPALFSDFDTEMVDGYLWFKPQHSKV